MNQSNLWDSSPLIRWSNSIPTEHSVDEKCDEISYAVKVSHSYNQDKFNHDVDWAMFRGVRRFIVEMIRKYDPKVTRHDLRRLKVKQVIVEPLYVTELKSAMSYKFMLRGKHKLVRIADE